MAFNYDIDFKYCYPATCQLSNIYVTQCDPQSYNYLYYNAYQNQLRNLEKRQVTMEYWSRQLQYFRNLLKNFLAEVERPGDLKKLFATCNYDENSKKCFEKNRIFYNIDKNYCQCCCNSCLEKLFAQLCNALSVSWPCNKCNCSTCKSRQKPSCAKHYCTYSCDNSPGYCYIPCQTNYQVPTPGYSYYYYPCQMPASPRYCQTMPQQFTNCNCNCNCNNNNNTCCPPNCDACCNKCKFKNILNQINYILSSAEQLNNVPCTCACTCNIPCRKSCCSIKEIKEETITIKRESVVENDPNKSLRKSLENTTNTNKKTIAQHTPEYAGTRHKITEIENTLSSSENSESLQCNEEEKMAAPARVSFDCECEPMYVKNPKQGSIKNGRKHLSQSESETIDDASNLSEEYRNYSTCIKKQASIVLGEEYVSPSGTFEVLIQDQHNKSCKNTHNYNKHNDSGLVFQVDYVTYTKPKCKIGNEI